MPRLATKQLIEQVLYSDKEQPARASRVSPVYQRNFAHQREREYRRKTMRNLRSALD
jgi:hypothetical protein